VNLDPALSALAAALDGTGPAVEVLPGVAPGPPALTQVPEAPAGTAAVVRTSGSTGTPKRTLLPASALAASSAATAAEVGAEGQWLLALPLTYVAGLAVLTRSLHAGTRPVALDPEASFTAEAFTEAAEAMTHPVRLTSLVPTQLQRLLTEPSGRTLAALRRFDALLIGGGRTSDAVRGEAAKHGLAVRLTYGMSETCGGCVYDGVPLPGVQARSEGGRLLLGGPVVAGGYLGDPELTAAHFSTDADGVRWYRTEDLGTVSDGRVEVHGRADDVINTGGVKVSAGVIQRCVEALPGVEAALVVGVPDPEWDTAVGLAYVGDAESARIATAVRAGLGGPAVPRRILHLDALPLLPNGKPDRQGILRLLAAL